MKTPKCWMCGQKLTTNWVPSVVDYHTGCYRVGCRHCGWATYLTSATEEQAIDSAKVPITRNLSNGNLEKRTKTNEKEY